MTDINCARYIHLNPVKAGIVAVPEEFLWSSFKDYAVAARNNNFVDKNYLYGLFAEDKMEAAKALIRFTYSNEGTDDYNLLEPGETKELQVERIEAILAAQGLSIQSFATASWKEKRQLLSVIVQETDMSGRELAKLLGIAREVVYDVKRKAE